MLGPPLVCANEASADGVRVLSLSLSLWGVISWPNGTVQVQSNRRLGLQERTEVWKQVFGRFRDTDAADHEAAKDATKNDKLMAKLDKARKAEKMHEIWRIGRLHVRCTLFPPRTRLR